LVRFAGLKGRCPANLHTCFVCQCQQILITLVTVAVKAGDGMHACMHAAQQDCSTGAVQQHSRTAVQSQYSSAGGLAYSSSTAAVQQHSRTELLDMTPG
jgi:hypothetical protein